MEIHARCFFCQRAKICLLWRSGHIEPFIRSLARAPVSQASLPYSAPGVAFTLFYDQAQRFGGGSHAAYNVSYSRVKAPICSALRMKADQLRHAPENCLRVVIVCDADCNALSRTRASNGSFSAVEIAAEFLRTTSTVDVVLLVTTERVKPYDRWDLSLRLRTEVVMSKVAPTFRLTKEAISALKAFFAAAIPTLPKPMIDARNAALRCDTRDYGFGLHGGRTMSGRTIRISSRPAFEPLAGVVSTTEFERRHRWDKASAPQGPSNHLRAR
jgi:hypothetical protein